MTIKARETGGKPHRRSSSTGSDKSRQRLLVDVESGESLVLHKTKLHFSACLISVPFLVFCGTLCLSFPPDTPSCPCETFSVSYRLCFSSLLKKKKSAIVGGKSKAIHKRAHAYSIHDPCSQGRFRDVHLIDSVVEAAAVLGG